MINFYHGLIGSHVHFDATLAELGTQCGPCHNSDYSYLTQDYTDLLTSISMDHHVPSVRVGNSIGCRLAVHAAGPDDQLILTAPPFDYGRGSVPLAQDSVEAWIDALYVQKGQIAGEAEIAAFAVAQMRGLMQSRAQIRRLRGHKKAAQGFWLDPRVVAAQDRITFVLGEADFTTPVDEFSDFVRRELPGAAVEVWKDCGHAVPLDAPKQLAALIRHRWLRLKMANDDFACAS